MTADNHQTDDKPMGAAREQSAWQMLWPLILLFWVLDLGIKYAVSQQLELGERIAVLPVFDLILLHNTGAAFSFLADQGGWQRWLFLLVGVVVAVWIVIWLRQTEAHKRLLGFSLVAVLGGALGNLTERLMHGYVVDYLLFYWPPYYFPAFNLADSLIFCGAVGLVLDSFLHHRKAAQETAAASEN